MYKLNNEDLEEEFSMLLNSGKIAEIWYQACDSNLWEDATWEDFFTGNRAKVLFDESPYLPKYITKMRFVFKTIQDLQNVVQIGNDSEYSFFSELMLVDYLVLKYEGLLDAKYLLGSYQTKNGVYKKYKDNKIRSKNFSTPFIYATTKLLKLWMEKRNSIILEETKQFSKNNIVLEEHESVIHNLQQTFYEGKDNLFQSFCCLNPTVYI